MLLYSVLGCFQSATLPVLPWCAHCNNCLVLSPSLSPSPPPLLSLAHYLTLYGYLPISYLGCSQASSAPQSYLIFH
ncbi:hypothetical protein BDP55DRAFT_649083 [Colletotrichum godetiae]|uniref:Uncharacterized protein n=1 Tax=Colletotrichum godetiae TaxID=1209918 RepID=A0AAJ0AV79_9PEZI|nr:uncharacterized protein BDP55DRAFT_649083 [Colletotrichum godetiae]KAK1690945.1 hypothetical protein BDP55DRAFT_649083 [Colletotrichum godetiae]